MTALDPGTTTTAVSLDSFRRHDAWLRSALRELRRPLPNGGLLRAAVSVPLHSASATPIDPWRVLLDRRPGERAVAWRDAETRRCFAGLGEVALLEAEGPTRFTDLGAALLRIAGETDSPPVAQHVPLAFLGFAFTERSHVGPVAASEPSPWAAWPNACALVPALVVAWDEGAPETPATIVVHVRANNDPDAHRLLRAGLERALAAISRPAPPAPTPAGCAELHDDEGRDAWCDRVLAATGAVGNAVLDKVVLARRRVALAPSAAAFDPVATLTRLREANPASHAFAWTHGDQAFVGATPELLVRASAGALDTLALAGTTARTGTPAADDAAAAALLASTKDRAEHDLVVAALRARLAPLCADLALPAVPEVRALPTLLHLATPVRGRLREGVSFLAAAQALHPTPAVGGWPSAEAARWLADREPLDRGWYGGCVGWIGPDGDGTLAVAIRSALLDGPRAHLYAGAGIVAASDPGAEWDETSLKLRTAADGLVAAHAPNPSVAPGTDPGSAP